MPLARGRGLVGVIIIAGWALTAQAAPKRAAPQAHSEKIVVVPGAGEGAPSLNSQINGVFVKSLAKRFTIIPYGVYARAARDSGIKGHALHTADGAMRVARSVGATHVLLVQSMREGGDKRRRNTGQLSLNATLVDTATGETLLLKRYALPAKKLTPPVTRQMLTDVRLALASKSPVPSPPLEAPLPALATPAAKPPPSTPVDLERNRVEEQSIIADAQKGSTDPNAVVPSVVAQTSSAKSRTRPALRLTFGTAAFSRQAYVHVQKYDPVCYCEPAGKRPPVFSRFTLSMELFPFGFDPQEHWYEGLGLFAGANVGFVKTAINEKSTVSSTAGGYEWALGYRLIMPAPMQGLDLTAKLGYAVYSFPLSGAQFPGVGYRSLFGALGLNYVFNDWSALWLDAAYHFRVVGYGGTKALGVQRDAGNALRVSMGPRFTLLQGLEVGVNVFYERFSVPFVGPTRLLGRDTQYNDVKLQDGYFGAALSLGFVTQ